MEDFDPNREQQVWQRVLSEPQGTAGTDFRELQRTAMELAGIYRNLAGTLTGKGRELAKQLHAGETDNVRCLRGIGKLSGRGGEVLKVWNSTGQSPGKVLEICYHRTRWCMAEYTAHSLEPEFGEVFRQLAQWEGQQCVRIAQLLGSLEK